jgi:hypothetical protein
MDSYNIIPMGDNCMVAQILKDLNLRKNSYPFDWVSHEKYYSKTNIMYNFEILEKLMKDEFDINHFLGDAFTNGRKVYRNIWFPHDHETNIEDIYSKYKRRFDRLKADVLSKPNIFIFLTRHFVIGEDAFDKILQQVLSYNHENKIIFIHGSPHPYLNNSKYKQSVAYQYLVYDMNKITPDMNYDIYEYRPFVSSYIRTLFVKIGILH